MGDIMKTGKVAMWRILSTGEILTVRITAGHSSFVKLINSHKNMKFISWN